MKYRYIAVLFLTGIIYQSCGIDLDRPTSTFNNCQEACIAFEGEVYFRDDLQPAQEVRVALNKERDGWTSIVDSRDELAFGITDQNGRFEFELSQLELDPDIEFLWLSTEALGIFNDGTNVSTYLITPDQRGKTIVQDLVVRRSKTVVLKLQRPANATEIIRLSTTVTADREPVTTNRFFDPPTRTGIVLPLSFPANLDAVMTATIEREDGPSEVISASIPSSFTAGDTLTFIID